MNLVIRRTQLNPVNAEQLTKHYEAIDAVKHILLVTDIGGLSRVSHSTKTSIMSVSSKFGEHNSLFGALHMPSDPVVLTRDDILLPTDTLTKLGEAWQSQPETAHGLFGQEVDLVTGASNPTHGSVSMLSDRCMVLSRDSIAVALGSLLQLIDDIPGVPRGDGADLALSCSIAMIRGTPNEAHDLPFIDLPVAPNWRNLRLTIPARINRPRDIAQWLRKNVVAPEPFQRRLASLAHDMQAAADDMHAKMAVTPEMLNSPMTI